MADWIQQYSAALRAKDAKEQAHRPYIDAYTALADRTSQQPGPAPIAKPTTPNPNPQTPSKGDRTSTPTKSQNPEQTPTDLLASLRADLASTQKARSNLQTQLNDLTSQLSALSVQQKDSQSRINALSKQVAELERKLHDRDEELRGKSKMVVHAQDEMVALELQFNLAEQRSEKLEKENKELVERWMKRMGEEAERVNRDSRWE